MQGFPPQNISYTTFKLNGFLTLGEWRPILSIPYFLMFLLSTISNSIIIYLIVSQKTLHSPMYVLIGFMAVVDLCWPIFFVPSLMLNFLFDWNGISLVSCLIQMFCIQILGAFQSTVLVWMALDRFFAICRPLYYHRYMEFKSFLKFIIVPVTRNLFLKIIMTSLAGKLNFCTINEIDHCFCEHMGLVQLACGDTSINNVIGLASAFLIPTSDFLFITASYIIIFASIMKSGKAHLKAINTCITHIIVMTVNLAFALIAFMSYRIRNNFSPNIRVFLSTMYILFPCCFNPIIYGVRTTEIRKQFLKFLNHMKVLPQ
ncbi:olfactory receptor 52K1-like [Pangasianodon hypophthalmus]|uniref:olfactory receptor 52K1-like n=1 Tax=Pangasianodon hypophthalmus TaxID=310915 RepID=UPI00147D5C80|nr:olfactory receptor 52K1-like [Pangasianodon hypophthalmus]